MLLHNILPGEGEKFDYGTGRPSSTRESFDGKSRWPFDTMYQHWYLNSVKHCLSAFKILFSSCLVYIHIQTAP